MDIDEVLKKAGNFGRVQKHLFALICLLQTPSCFFLLFITFAGMTPEWHCSGNHSKMSSETKCELYSKNNCAPVYDQKGFHTIVHEWELICDSAALISLSQSGVFLGFLIGSYILGQLADRFGRKKIIIGCLSCLVIVGVLVTFSPSIKIFSLCRVLTGFLIAGWLSFYILVCEVIGPSYRSWLSVMVATSFALSFILLSLVSYVASHWKTLSIVSSVLVLPILFMYRYIPESPRWLLVTGNDAEAKRVLMSIATTNGNSLPTDFVLKVAVDNEGTSAGLMELFSHKILKFRTLILMFLWFTNCMVYYSLSLGVGSLSDSIYVSFSLSGLVEIPSHVAALVFLERLGRKWTNVGFLFCACLATITCALLQFGNVDGYYLIMILALAGKFAISASFDAIFVYTPEIFPTDVRNLAMGICNVAARAGGILAPLVILLDLMTAGLSLLVMGLIAGVASYLSLSLPETLNVPLLHTINDIQ